MTVAMARAPHSRWMTRAKHVRVVMYLGAGDDIHMYTVNTRLELGEFRAAMLIVG